jgi:hypothetical protein
LGVPGYNLPDGSPSHLFHRRKDFWRLSGGRLRHDAFATSFVEGRLRGEKLRVRIDSVCHHCSRPLAIKVDDELRWHVESPRASPLLFEPGVDWHSFRGPNIIHDY